MIDKYSWGKFIIATLFAVTAAVLFSCCENTDVVVAPPTLVVPTPMPTETFSYIVAPTATPNAEEEIHFSDSNLENVVRNIVGKNIGPIMRSDVENIKSLSARVRGISNINALQYFTALENIDLYGNRITDLTPLTNLTSLKSLNIGKNYNVLTAVNPGQTGLDISPLKGLALLEELDASDNMLTNIDALRSLNSLKRLILTKNRLCDISPLAGCKMLKYVDISYNYGLNEDNTTRGISDISPLFDIKTLEIINASNNIIENITGIESLVNLYDIDLSANYISDILPLNKLQSVKKINLHYNSLMNIDGFANNEVIEELDVSQNMITHFDVILTMRNLKSLNWAQNIIQDYGPIEEFEEKKE